MDIFEIFSLLWRGIDAVWSFFADFLTNLGIEWYNLVIGMVFAAAFWRLIIIPIFGGRVSLGSDGVKKVDAEFSKFDKDNSGGTFLDIKR